MPDDACDLEPALTAALFRRAAAPEPPPKLGAHADVLAREYFRCVVQDLVVRAADCTDQDLIDIDAVEAIVALALLHFT